MANILRVRPKTYAGVAIRIERAYDLAVPVGENMMHQLQTGNWVVTLADGTQAIFNNEAAMREVFEVLGEDERP